VVAAYRVAVTELCTHRNLHLEISIALSNFNKLLFLYLAVLGLELRALCLLGRFSTT
jgi:hypothetical protein